MKAKQTELSATFKNMLTEVMARLNINASNNVIFFLTHAASVNFQPDATQKENLETFLASKNLQIALRQDSDGVRNATIYCFENDSVQYLAEQRVPCENDIPVPDGFDGSPLATHWSRSQESAARVISYVCGLRPLPLADVMAIYDVQYITGILSEFVLKTLKHDAVNESHFASKKAEAEEIKDQVPINPAAIAKFDPNVETVRVVHKKLHWENLVCGGKKCVEIANDEVVYTKICCTSCRSLFVYFCGRMNITGTCRVCNCSMNEHRYTKRKSTVERDPECVVKFENGAAGTQENRSRDPGIYLETLIDAYNKRVRQYQLERRHMLETCAKLNTYLKNVLGESHAVDEMKRNLEHMIAKDQSAVHSGLTAKLQGILIQYNQCLQEAGQTRMTSADVRPLIEKLYDEDILPLNGKNLRAAMEAEESGRLRSDEKTGDQTR